MMIAAFDSLARKHAKEMDEAQEAIVEYQVLCQELLAALQAMLAKHDDRDAPSDLWPAEAAQARAAIAKATTVEVDGDDDEDEEEG